MYRYKNLLVGLNWDDHDPSIIHYAAHVSKLAKAENVYFVHVYNSGEEAHEISSVHSEIRGTSENCTQNCLKDLIEPNWDGDKATKLHYNVVESGHPLPELLKCVKNLEIDLLLVGRKSGRRVSGTIAENLVRKAPCSVLMVPWGVRSFFKKVLVPMDFSSHSKNALEVATNMAKAAKLDEVSVAHVYDVPLGYHKTGKTYEEVDEIMRLHAKEHYDAFVHDLDQKAVTFHPIFRLNRHPDEEILDLAWELPADMIVMGSRGMGAVAAALLGSNTEYLIKNSTVPVLAVKEKGQGMGMLDAFLEMINPEQ